MGNFVSKIDWAWAIESFLIFSIPMLLLLLVTRPKYRRQLLLVALIFALLMGIAKSLPIYSDLAWNVGCALLGLLPLIYLFFVLLSLAESKKQVLYITLIPIAVILFSWIKDIIPDMIKLPFTLVSICFLTWLLIILIKKVGKKEVRFHQTFLFFLVIVFLILYACLIGGRSTISFQREMAKRLGYTDVRLYFRDQEEATPQKDLQKLRMAINNYFQENGMYLPILDSQICAEYSYWFIWDEVPGKSDSLFINFLEKNFKISWVKDAGIKKSSDNKSIMVRKGRNLITLQLKENRISVKVSDEPPWTYPVKERNDKLYIYSCLYPYLNNEFPGFSEADHRWSNNIVIIRTKPNQKIQPDQITDEGGWIYSPNSGDIRINCSHKDSKGVPYYEW